MVKHKAIELNPMVFGTILPPHNVDGSKSDRNKQAARCRRFLVRHRLSIRAVKRKGQKLLRGWAGTASGAVKDLREPRSHVPTAVNRREGTGGCFLFSISGVVLATPDQANCCDP